MGIKIFGKLTGRNKFIQAGEYLISPKDSILKFLNNVAEGNIYYRQVRFKEGSTFKDLLSILIENPFILKNKNIEDYSLISAHLNILSTSLEGIFYPDTYYFKKGDSYLEILKRAHHKHKNVLKEIWQLRRVGLPYKNSYEALILASIIEKEGIEKKEIAGVFVRRLLSNMKLQSDPTVIYALGEKFTGNLTKAHLLMNHPYNTYKTQGLPPSPIGLVSHSSIEAAINPANNANIMHSIP